MTAKRIKWHHFKEITSQSRVSNWYLYQYRLRDNITVSQYKSIKAYNKVQMLTSNNYACNMRIFKINFQDLLSSFSQK